MAEPYLSEIRIFAFPFAPTGWAFCNGQALPIMQNQALNALLGTMYNVGSVPAGTFMLPNLSGRVPVHQDFRDTDNYRQGAIGGVPTCTLAANQIPMHTHQVAAFNGPADKTSPLGNYLATSTNPSYYAPTDTTVQPLSPSSIGVAGGGVGHNNIQPSLVLNYCIALQGYFPPRE